jgi:dolichol-phosphate mannosyltransferase
MRFPKSGTEFREVSSMPATQIVRRYVQFCLVGGSGVCVDMAILWTLSSQSVLGWNLTLSKAIAAELAIINNFVWNDLWTFRSVGDTRKQFFAVLWRFGKFHAICVTGVVCSVLLLNVQVYQMHFNVYVSNFVAIVIVSLWNFCANLCFGWGGKLKGINAHKRA